MYAPTGVRGDSLGRGQCRGEGGGRRRLGDGCGDGLVLIRREEVSCPHDDVHAGACADTNTDADATTSWSDPRQMKIPDEKEIHIRPMMTVLLSAAAARSVFEAYYASSVSISTPPPSAMRRMKKTKRRRRGRRCGRVTGTVVPVATTTNPLLILLSHSSHLLCFLVVMMTGLLLQADALRLPATSTSRVGVGVFAPTPTVRSRGTPLSSPRSSSSWTSRWTLSSTSLASPSSFGLGRPDHYSRERHLNGLSAHTRRCAASRWWTWTEVGRRRHHMGPAPHHTFVPGVATGVPDPSSSRGVPTSLSAAAASDGVSREADDSEDEREREPTKEESDDGGGSPVRGSSDVMAGDDDLGDGVGGGRPDHFDGDLGPGWDGGGDGGAATAVAADIGGDAIDVCSNLVGEVGGRSAWEGVKDEEDPKRPQRTGRLDHIVDAEVIVLPRPSSSSSSSTLLGGGPRPDTGHSSVYFGAGSAGPSSYSSSPNPSTDLDAALDRARSLPLRNLLDELDVRGVRYRPTDTRTRLEYLLAEDLPEDSREGGRWGGGEGVDVDFVGGPKNVQNVVGHGHRGESSTPTVAGRDVYVPRKRRHPSPSSSDVSQWENGEGRPDGGENRRFVRRSTRGPPSRRNDNRSASGTGRRRSRHPAAAAVRWRRRPHGGGSVRVPTTGEMVGDAIATGGRVARSVIRGAVSFVDMVMAGGDIDYGVDSVERRDWVCRQGATAGAGGGADTKWHRTAGGGRLEEDHTAAGRAGRYDVDDGGSFPPSPPFEPRPPRRRAPSIQSTDSYSGRRRRRPSPTIRLSDSGGNVSDSASSTIQSSSRRRSRRRPQPWRRRVHAGSHRRVAARHHSSSRRTNVAAAGAAAVVAGRQSRLLLPPAGIGAVAMTTTTTGGDTSPSVNSDDDGGVNVSERDLDRFRRPRTTSSSDDALTPAATAAHRRGDKGDSSSPPRNGDDAPPSRLARGDGDVVERAGQRERLSSAIGDGYRRPSPPSPFLSSSSGRHWHDHALPANDAGYGTKLRGIRTGDSSASASVNGGVPRGRTPHGGHQRRPQPQRQWRERLTERVDHLLGIHEGGRFHDSWWGDRKGTERDDGESFGDEGLYSIVMGRRRQLGVGGLEGLKERTGDLAFWDEDGSLLSLVLGKSSERLKRSGLRDILPSREKGVNSVTLLLGSLFKTGIVVSGRVFRWATVRGTLPQPVVVFSVLTAALSAPRRSRMLAVSLTLLAVRTVGEALHGYMYGGLGGMDWDDDNVDGGYPSYTTPSSSSSSPSGSSDEATDVEEYKA